ncbi:MAG: hypothetical protein K6E51_01730 [Treponema sp.]|nr:hypothetical protein [Treponema sp.]
MLSQRDIERDKHVQDVLCWRESMTRLPDKQFFELMRMYLGEIKTPYNKQKLIEELGAFLRHDSNRKILVRLLSEADIQIISAISFIPDSTQERLNDFFSGTFSYAALYERLLNLEERLIIYYKKDAASGSYVLAINPLLDDILASYISLSAILPHPLCAVPFDGTLFVPSPLLLAAFISFVYGHADLCKADGAFKKRTYNAITTIFPGKEKYLQLLTQAWIHLSLIKEDKDGFFVDYARFVSFAQLEEYFQYVYICVASCGHISRTGLRAQSQLLLDIAASVPDCGYTKDSLLRLGLIIAARRGRSDMNVPLRGSRFSQILNKYHQEEKEPASEEVSLSVVERLIEAAITGGIFVQKGSDGSGQAIYASNDLFKSAAQPIPYVDTVLNIDAAFTVTTFPGMPLAGLLPMVQCMDIVHFDATAEYVITKKSVLRSFDMGLSPGQILNMFVDACLYDIPQNLKVSIDEWYHTYSSASLYQGFVLKVDADNDQLSQKNPKLASHIRAVLAPGVYLLDVNTTDEAEQVMLDSGIDYIGSVKTVHDNVAITSFPLLRGGLDVFASNRNASAADQISVKEQDLYLRELHQQVEAMQLDRDRLEGLKDRIDRKIILTPVQLRPESVRIENNEASGMDFVGKIRLVEKAMETRSMIELVFDVRQEIHDTVMPRIIGTPLAIEKQGEDALVRVRVEPDQSEQLFSIGQARMVRRLRSSLFHEVRSK